MQLDAFWDLTNHDFGVSHHHHARVSIIFNVFLLCVCVRSQNDEDDDEEDSSDDDDDDGDAPTQPAVSDVAADITQTPPTPDVSECLNE